MPRLIVSQDTHTPHEEGEIRHERNGRCDSFAICSSHNFFSLPPILAHMRRRTFDDVTVSVPDTWLNASVITLVATDSKVFQPSLVISREEAPTGSVERHAKSLLPDIERQMRKHQLVEQGDAEVANQPAWRMVHRFQTPDGVVAVQEQLFFVSGDDLVVVALTCAQAELDARQASFAAIAASLRLVEE